MARQPMSLRELADKVDWEGGPIEALEYGITAQDVADPALHDLWKELEERYRGLTPLVREIRIRLRSAA